MAESSGPPAVRGPGADLWRAYKKGTPEDIANAAMSELAKAGVGGDERVSMALRHIAALAVQVRRQDVAVVGDREAFVRQTDQGDLVQVVRPVTLSLPENDLYQIVKFAWMPGAEANRLGLDVLDTWRGRGPRQGQVKVKAPTASPLMQGVHKINAIVGLSAAETPTVSVDGIPDLPNPYVQRANVADDPLYEGSLGDLMRIVVRIAVVGAAPGTGNMVAVQYTLDHEPRKELLDIIGQLATGENKYGDAIGGNIAEHCYLTTARDARRRLDQQDFRGWEYLPQYGGVGYFYDPTHEAIGEAYRTFNGILASAIKKAQTVARRNAMMHHPALGAYRSIGVNAAGSARLAVTGWAGGSGALGWYMRAAGNLARGLPMPEGIDVIDVHESTDDIEAGEIEEQDATEQGVTSPAPIEVRSEKGQQQAASEPEDADGGCTPDEGANGTHGDSGAPSEPKPVSFTAGQRREVIAYIDQRVGELTPIEARALEYDPENDDDERLVAIKAQLDAMADLD